MLVPSPAGAMATFGERLARLRKDAGITQTELARRIGGSQSAISQIEKGERKPSYDTIQQLAGALGVTPAYLLGAEVEDLTPEERQHFRQYRGLPEKAREALREYASHLWQKYRSEGSQ